MRSSAKLAARLLRSSQSRICHAAPTISRSSLCPRFLSTGTSRLNEIGANNAILSFQLRSFSAAATSEPVPNLIDVIKEELEYERSPEGSIESIEQPPPEWTLTEQEGGSTVKLARQFGGEQIIITMDIQPEERDLFPFDKDVADEGFDEAAEETQEVEALDQADDGIVDPDVAILFDVEIEKRGDRISFEAAFDGEFIELRHVSHSNDSEDTFDGPDFSTLDAGLQQAFVSYLEERGIDAAMGEYLMSVHEVKEQKEYVNWLARIEKFLVHGISYYLSRITDVIDGIGTSRDFDSC